MVIWTGLLVARAKKQAPKPKRAERYLPGSPLFVSVKKRGGKGIAGLKRRKPASGKEEPPPFLARRMLFCPGMGPLGVRDLSLLEEPAENKNLSKKAEIPFSTNMEMIRVFLIAAPTPNKGGTTMEKGIQWEKELKMALQRAKAEKKNIILFFHNPN